MHHFSIALDNMLLLNSMDLRMELLVPIILAIMLNEIRSKGVKHVFRTMMYLPHFLIWIIIGGMVLEIFAPTTIVVNATLLRFGIVEKTVLFLTDGRSWHLPYTQVGVWRSMDWGTILYLSDMIGINMELFEAARIDGANKMQPNWHVTLPGIRSTIIVLLIMNIGQMMNIGFNSPCFMGNPLVQDSCDVLSTFVYRMGITKSKVERTTAICLFRSVVCLIMITTANFITKRLGVW